VSVIDAARCNAQNTTGCRHPAPAFSSQPGALAADPAVHTLYDTSGANTVSMIDTRSCNTHRLAGCGQTPTTVTVGDFPSAVAVDSRTHTVYVANSGAATTGTVSVIDARTCNATDSTGCGNVHTLQVPAGHARDIAVNPATDTVYIATLTSSGPNIVSVFNGAICNAETTLGCDQTPATLAIADSGGGNSALNIAVNQATNTIYAINLVFPPNNAPQIGETVYVINGAACDAANTTGCGQTPATIRTGNNTNPTGIAVDQTTDTIYTANIWDGEYAGTVSVINGATCNGSNTTGCGQTPTTVTAGFGAAGVAIDHATQRVYVTNIEDTSVSVINGNTCNGTRTTGCAETPPKVAVGNYPVAVAIDAVVDSGYIANLDNTISVIPLTR
jgi:DNA-binding beta-propeller fold protein YncE